MTEVFSKNALAMAALYLAEGQEAHRCATQLWSPGAKLSYMFVQGAEVFARYVSGLSAVAAYRSERDGGLLRVAARHARGLERVPSAWAKPLGLSVHAAIADSCGRRDQAVAALRSALRQFQDCGMQLHLAAAERQIGLLTRDATEVQRGDRRMVDLGVLAPARFARTHAAGL